MDSFTLNCWVRSQDPARGFQVKVSKTDTVYDLQEAIKNKNSATFRDVPAFSLDLYKPKDPLSKPFKENLSKFTLVEHAELLDAVDELWEVFPELPARRDIHVIVDAPSTITCWMRGRRLEQCFVISIRPGDDIDQLIPEVKKALPTLAGVAHYLIHFYKISGDDNELREHLNKTGGGELLRRGPLVPVFVDLPVLCPLCVVVEVSAHPSKLIILTRLSDSRMTVLTNPSVLSHPIPAGQDPVAAARNAFINARPQDESLSDSAKTSAFHRMQDRRITQITCGRPRDPEELIPVTLLHPIFAQFAEDCGAGVMKDANNDFVGEMANAMSALRTSNEDMRLKSVSEVFEMVHLYLDLNTKANGMNPMMDASVSINDADLPPYFIGEFKNEIGSPTSEPYIQAITNYLEATKKFAQIQSKSTLPCFLLMVFGSYMVFAGAVWNLRPVVQILSHPVSFEHHSTHIDNVVRHMAAFRKAIRSLKVHHEDRLRGIVPDHQAGQELFPYYTTFTSLDDGSKQTFVYTNQLIDDDGGKTKLVFFGALKGDRTARICIKFTRRYSKEAHLHCAELGFAPRLRGFQVLPGGWMMIVMDNLIGYDLLADFGEENLPRSTFKAIRTQLKTLHARNLVHGDIRDTNIFISRDRKNFMIIDFDWAGVAGEVRYPPFVNWKTILRPEDARDGERITVDHDLDMLRFMIDAWADTD